jgi:hypothetical protein
MLEMAKQSDLKEGLGECGDSQEITEVMQLQ